MKDLVTELIIKAQHYEEGALEELYRLTYKNAFYMAMKICRDEQDAQDVCQEAFIQIQKSIHGLKDPQSYFLWLSRIVSSKAIRLFQKKKHIALDKDMLENLPNQLEYRKSFLPNILLNDDTEAMIIRAFIDELTPKLKEVVQCVYLHQMTMEECAKYLNMKEGTVKSRLHAARKVLRVKIENYQTQENRWINFYEGVSAWLFMQWILCKETMKHSKFVHNSMIAVGSATTAGLMVVAGTQLYQNAQNEALPKTISPQISEPFFVTYKNQEYKNVKDAYYLIKNWGQDVELVHNNDPEIYYLQPVYQAIKQSKSPYYELLLQENWNKIFEK